MTHYEKLNDGIVCIDTEQHRPGLAAAYLLGNNGHYAFIECGTSLSVPALLQTLVELDISTAAVDYVMPTHVHLDHAGGAGALMQALPNARLVAHPRAAKHLIDPARLIVGATAVYGAAAMKELYGDIVAVPQSRVIVADVADDHDFSLYVGKRPLTFIDAPGHASHHYAVWDEASRGWFSGDVFGMSYRAFDSAHGAYLLPTTTPVGFNPQAWDTTLDRMMARTPAHIYLTHYGRVDDVLPLCKKLREDIAAYQRIAQKHEADEDREQSLADGLMAYHIGQLRQCRHPLPEARARQLLAMDIGLNAQGLDVWLQRQHKAVKASA